MLQFDAPIDRDARPVNAVCEHCGAIDGERIRPLIKRGALTLRSDPPAIWWNDRLVPLSPLEVGMMEELMRHGRVAWADLEAQLAISVGTRVTLMHRIRHKFRTIGAEDPLQTVRYWGLRLRVQPDARQSRAVWIGADESHESFIRAGSADHGPARAPQFQDARNASHP